MTEEEKKLSPEEERLIIAFVQGASWWEYHETNFTMWSNSRNLIEKEALKRLENGTLGKVTK